MPRIVTGRPLCLATAMGTSTSTRSRVTISNAPRSYSASTRVSSMTSASLASRLGTGLPSPPMWVGAIEVENPSAPASMASRTWARMASISSGVASRSVAASPITK